MAYKHSDIVLVKHSGHDMLTWAYPQTYRAYLERRKQIREYKPAEEHAIRFKRIGVVSEPMAAALWEAYAALWEAYVAWQEADAAWSEADVAWSEAYVARREAAAAWQEADAARREAAVAWQEADVALREAAAAWQEVANSPEGLAFHAKVCGCPWTPESNDILRNG